MGGGGAAGGARGRAVRTLTASAGVLKPRPTERLYRSCPPCKSFLAGIVASFLKPKLTLACFWNDFCVCARGGGGGGGAVSAARRAGQGRTGARTCSRLMAASTASGIDAVLMPVALLAAILGGKSRGWLEASGAHQLISCHWQRLLAPVGGFGWPAHWLP